MATDQMILGGVVFDDWMTPSDMAFGGKHALKVHKLPGGSRVIDTLGPDEMDLKIKGTIWAPNANEIAESLNGMRLAGVPVALTFGGNFYSVIVEECVPHIRRFPQWYEFDITCVVASNPMAGGLDASVSTFGSLVSADLASALSIAGQ